MSRALGIGRGGRDRSSRAGVVWCGRIARWCGLAAQCSGTCSIVGVLTTQRPLGGWHLRAHSLCRVTADPVPTNFELYSVLWWAIITGFPKVGARPFSLRHHPPTPSANPSQATASAQNPGKRIPDSQRVGWAKTGSIAAAVRSTLSSLLVAESPPTLSLQCRMLDLSLSTANATRRDDHIARQDRAERRQVL